MLLPDKNLPWPICWDAVQEIARSEGCRLKAYRCPAGVWTIGWGETDGVQPGDTMSQSEADQRLLQDLTIRSAKVLDLITDPPSENELGAMTSLAYNIGLRAFAKSTVLRQHNAGNPLAAARAFGLWNKSKGTVLPGLTARRSRESALYLTDNDGRPMDMPQSIDQESNLGASPIAQSGIGSILSGLAAAAAGLSDQIKQVAADLATNPLYVVAAVGVIAGGVVLYQRLKQRQEGWA